MEEGGVDFVGVDLEVDLVTVRGVVRGKGGRQERRGKEKGKIASLEMGAGIEEKGRECQSFELENWKTTVLT